MAEGDTTRPNLSNRPAPDNTPRRPYAKPHLIEYGSVTKLTQGTRTVGGDGPGGGFMSKR